MRALIAGGAGFIGSNLAERWLSRGWKVTVLDNFSRPGSEENAAWLAARHAPPALRVLRASVLDRQALRRAVEDAEVIVHLAGQVAVTTSLAEPFRDFCDNALGTLNVLEAARRFGRDPIVLYASTNKVYGPLGALRVVEEATRYVVPERPFGIDETHPLDLASPYACSKGCGDVYARDYARSYGLRTVVFRQSCVYGPRQFGVEDQGWVAWFLRAALAGRAITVYGNGKQVRDLLYIDDLLDAYDAAIERIGAVAGGVFNIGGGPANATSVWVEFEPQLSTLVGRQVEARQAPPRPGDQRYYVSDTRRATAALGWRPTTPIADGLERLLRWIVDDRVALG